MSRSRAWGTFKKDWRGLWGDFIAVDENTLKENSFTKAKILIASKAKSKIEEEINLDVDGKIYSVQIFEVVNLVI